MNPHLKILFQDNYLLVLEKPAGLVVTSSETQKEPSLEDILREDFHLTIERSGIVHRLDKDTSGLLVVAKTAEALENLQSQFKLRTVKKKYITLVHGFLKDERLIEGSIGRNPGDREKFTVIESFDAKPAVTVIKPTGLYKMNDAKLEGIFEGFSKVQFMKLHNMNYSNFTLIEAYPQTGRTHQIRVHLKYIGFPIVGDEKYGGRKVVRLDRRWCKRQFLHAAVLEFTHPNGERLSFESDLSQDLKISLEALEKIT